jgi:Cu2+-exporting ATPase
LLSGDNQASVDRFAADLNLDEALGDLRPSDKLRWIRECQANGGRVAMLGDGINDAPTLAAADVSVSFAHATELAQVNSGLLVLGSELGVISEMRILAEKIRRIIRQNLIWAAGYNLLAVPVAALGLIAPWGAAIGMSLSSLLVVANALRLRGRPAGK